MFKLDERKIQGFSNQDRRIHRGPLMIGFRLRGEFQFTKHTKRYIRPPKLHHYNNHNIKSTVFALQFVSTQIPIKYTRIRVVWRGAIASHRCISVYNREQAYNSAIDHYNEHTITQSGKRRGEQHTSRCWKRIRSAAQVVALSMVER